ncbi:MAG: hypothetical protein D6B27_08710 [Gammaproteobacteria bacterium]|nr:MAG: hypothetical protein D6B27_08710 [Gammaproteobacteria bacterium]
MDLYKKIFSIKYTVAALIVYLLINSTAFPASLKQSSLPDIDIIVNANNPIKTISLTTLQRIFMDKENTFPDGTKAIPIYQEFGRTPRQTFLSLYLNKSEPQLKAYWVRRVFTGMGMHPRSLENCESVIKWIGKNTEAIGFVSAGSANNNSKIRTIKVIGIQELAEGKQ